MAKINRNPPRFLWQGILILMPVVIMASFGFWAILQERGRVEEDARQAILQAIPADVGTSVAEQLHEYKIPGTFWPVYQGVMAQWPGSQTRQQYLSAKYNIAMINDIKALRKSFPDSRGDNLPIVLSMETNGTFANFGSPHVLDVDQPPQPPTWFVSLSPEQRRIWSAISESDYKKAGAQSVTRLIQEFLKTDPPPDAIVNADFIRLRDASQTKPAPEAIDSLLLFYADHFDTLSESGLPVAQLALIEALRRARQTGFTEALWNDLQTETESRPTLLVPGILNEAKRDILQNSRRSCVESIIVNDAPQLRNVNVRNSQLLDPLEALQELWDANTPETQLAEAVTSCGLLNAGLPTNWWITALGQQWFCLTQPESTVQIFKSSNGRIASITTNHWLEVTCYPLAAIEKGFVAAFKAAKITPPPYLAISVALAGKPVPLPSPWNTNRIQSPDDIFARDQFVMSAPVTQVGVDPNSGQREETQSDDMPSHPDFTLQIHLINRRLLFAQQRHRQYIFGTLIGLSALTALIGFIAAARAFDRQQLLNELKTNFVSSVSHELRAPIASVRLMAENLERGKIPEASRQNEYFRFIVQECRRLSSLIENVLDFSRIEQGRKQYELEPVNLAALVQTTVKLLEPYAAERGVRLVIACQQSRTHKQAGGTAVPGSLDDPLPSIELEVDSRAIQQALVNLIDNAIKHSPKGETVTVEIHGHPGTAEQKKIGENEAAILRAQAERRQVLITVADHGPGIPREEHEKIFERFYRRGSELRRETQGVGIGLSVVKHIIEAHGGRVLVDSEPGRGSRFTIELASASPQKKSEPT